MQKCERGETTAQTVLILPVLLLCLWIGVHSALLFHTSSVANAVVNVVARRASTDPTATASSLNTFAADTAHQLGGTLNGVVVVNRDDRFVSVSVLISGPRVVPMLPTSIRRSVVVPI